MRRIVQSAGLWISAAWAGVARHVVSPGFLFREVRSGVGRHRGTAIAAVITTTIGLVMLGGALLAAAQIGAAKGSWYGKTHVGIYFKSAATSSEIHQVRSALDRDDAVEEVWFEDQDEAYANFAAQFSHSPDLLAEVTVEHMPRSFRVKLYDPAQGDELVEKFATETGVRQVVDEHAQLSGLFSVLTGVQRAALLLAAIQMAATTVLVTNMVRSTIAARARELEIGRIMGATRPQLAIPLLVEVALYGVVSAGGAFALLSAAKHYLIDGRLAQTGLADMFVNFITWDAVVATIPWLVVGGIALPLVASIPVLHRRVQT